MLLPRKRFPREIWSQLFPLETPSNSFSVTYYFLWFGYWERKGRLLAQMVLDFTTLEVLFTSGFPALRDISPCKRARLSISKHSATTSLASSSCCQMPSLFLKLCIQGTPLFFFLLEILSKKNTMFWVAWPKFSCTFASLPNFLFLAKQFIILLVL